MKVNTKIPVHFQKLDEYDNRFMKVKIYLMHLGENLNGSFFSRESVEKAISSLKNTPILAYIEDGDFSDHRMALTRGSEGEWSFKYLGSAYGLIPESNNAQFEFREDENGVMREYLTVEGLIWTKFDDAVDIFNNNHVKSQSMELHDDYTGYFNQTDGLFHFENFRFYGACALGVDVSPAMVGSTIEMYTMNKENIWKEIQTKMEEFKFIQCSLENQEKGGNAMNEKLDLLQKYSITQEELEAKGINFEEISLEELQTTLESFNVEEKVQAEVEDQPNSEDDDGESKIVAEDVDTNHSASVDETGENSVDDSFSKEEETNTEFEEVKTKLEKVEKDFTDLQAKYSALELEVVSLRSFKSGIEAESRKEAEEAIFSTFAEKLDEEEMAEIKASASSMSVEEIEMKLYAVLGKKMAKFSTVKREKTSIKVGIDGSSQDIKKHTKPYGDLIERYSGSKTIN